MEGNFLIWFNSGTLLERERKNSGYVTIRWLEKHFTGSTHVFIGLSFFNYLVKSIFDFIITVTYGATLSSIITSEKISFADGAVILVMLASLQYIVAKLSVRSKKFADLIKSSPTFVYHKGQFNEERMQQERLRLEDLRAKVRQQGLSSFENVEAIVIEGDGSLSIVKKEDVHAKDALEGIKEE